MTLSQLETTHAAAPPGASAAPVGSWGMREGAVRDGNATAPIQTAPATRVSVAGG